jgi:hypothetical protein
MTRPMIWDTLPHRVFLEGEPAAVSTAKSTVLRELLGGIVDYAGLFPPAGLAMSAAVENFARYRKSGHSWMLGAFVLPAARLGEFVAAVQPWLEPDGEPWPLSLLLGSPVDENLRLAEATVEGLPLHVAAVECRSDALAQDLSSLPPQLDAYFEVALSPTLLESLESLAAAGRFAKLRTGSMRAAEIPTSVQIAEFIDACATLRLPFKATAGLHHPVRGDHALNYETDAPRATMHGFLNVFLAASLRVDPVADAGAFESLLNEDSAAAFRLEEESVLVGEYRISVDTIAAGRRFARSFGSCSFEEPIEDLRRMGWL